MNFKVVSRFYCDEDDQGESDDAEIQRSYSEHTSEKRETLDFSGEILDENPKNIMLAHWPTVRKANTFLSIFVLTLSTFLLFWCLGAGDYKFCAVASRILKRAKKKDLKGDEKMRFLAKLENVGGKVAFLPSIDTQLLLLPMLLFCYFKGRSFHFKKI